MHFVQFSLSELFNDRTADKSGAVERRILCRIVEMSRQLYALNGKILTSQLTHYKKLLVGILFHLLLG